MFSKSFDKISSFVKETSDEIGEKIKEVDDDVGISDKASEVSNSILKKVKTVNNEYNISDNFDKGIDELKALLSTAEESYSKSELKTKISELSVNLNESVFIPVNNKMEVYGVNKNLLIAKKQAVIGYGFIRGNFKEYKAPKDSRELLTTTREELVYINSCILQVSKKESEQLATNFGKALSAKVAGLASAGGLFALVSAFGSASTGTAIASLSGAAANSATLAWLGSLLGGGMVTGAIVTGGVGLAAGSVAYSALSSTPRDIESLSEEERQIIEGSVLLIAAIDEVLEKNPVQLSVTEAKILRNDIIKPLSEQIVSNKNLIMGNLDETNQIRFQEHALNDFQGNVIEGFEYYIEITPYRISPAFAISGVLYALLSGGELESTPENIIAVEALKRMNNEWSDYTQSELGVALSDYSSESLKGVANNAKGIYHELLFVEEFNSNNIEQQARVFEKTNEPGADIQIYSVDTGEIIQEAQLKALQDSSGIYHHFDRYPEVDIIATNEIASAFEHVQSSGFSNEELTADINSVISQLSSDNTIEVATETAAISLLISAGQEAIEVLNGRRNINEAGKQTVLNVSVATSSALIASYLFS